MFRKAIYNLFKENYYHQFYQYVKVFNARYKEYEFDKYSLAYFLHPDYKDADIAKKLKTNKHSKQQLADIFISQLRKFYLQDSLFTISFLPNIEDTYQEVYNAQIEEEEKENTNKTENQLNIDLDEYLIYII
ncbi:zinc finger bed domain-containing protein 1-like [Gigaspora margarita]|uniref:Zinc finger bed domain-containing protein 1-like n=1 Tax=Gigaspora margarita TaxID=4874 RepID=A0A8H4EK31_GIGMA|nr:zinc finger bed domain-containing protein 1-like [Gigaspora margarita]